MSNGALLIAHELLCVVLFYTVFYRAVRTCEKVRMDVRAAFWVLGLVACLGMCAPIVWGYRPDHFSIVLIAAIVIVQLITARHWSDSCPPRFYKPGLSPTEGDRNARHA